MTFIQESDARFDKEFPWQEIEHDCCLTTGHHAKNGQIKLHIHAEFGRLLEEVRKRMGIGFLRQWLNEDRNCEPMVSNEDLEKWLLPGLE